MKICFIGKYPPIEGGTASRLYWLARGLGAKGHEVHVVTNAFEVEDEYRENLTSEDLKYYQPPNVFVHNTDPFDDSHFIPYTKPYVAKIANLAINVIKEYHLEIIDSWYVLPYVISGFLAKSFTKKPQILRHAGSDMTRLFSSHELHSLFIELIKNVDMVVTHQEAKQQFLNLGVSKSKIFFGARSEVDTKFFNPRVPAIDLSAYTNRRIKNLPVITYIGKFGFTKGIFELIEALGGIKENFLLLLVTGGRESDRLKDLIAKYKLTNKTIFLGFVPPWKIPSIIKASICVVHAEHGFPIKTHYPIVPREVMAVGRCLVLSEELYEKRKSERIKDRVNVLVVNPKDIKSFRKILAKVISNPAYALEIGKRARKVSEERENFDEYITQTENLYRKVLKSG